MGRKTIGPRKDGYGDDEDELEEDTDPDAEEDV